MCFDDNFDLNICNEFEDLNFRSSVPFCSNDFKKHAACERQMLDLCRVRASRRGFDTRTSNGFAVPGYIGETQKYCIFWKRSFKKMRIGLFTTCFWFWSVLIYFALRCNLLDPKLRDNQLCLANLALSPSQRHQESCDAAPPSGRHLCHCAKSLSKVCCVWVEPASTICACSNGIAEKRTRTWHFLSPRVHP